MMPPFTIGKTKEKRKLAAKIIYDICTTNTEILHLITEKLMFSPLPGKIWLNSIPKGLTDKFNNNHELYTELKQFIESSNLIENNLSWFWTFPEFKATSCKTMSTRYTENVKDIDFPDPKYYMIGFTVQSELEQESTPGEGETTQNENTEEYGLTSKELSPDFETEYNNQSWKRQTVVINKTSLQPVDTNKEWDTKFIYFLFRT